MRLRKTDREREKERKREREKERKREREKEGEGGNAGHNYKIIILRTPLHLAVRHLEKRHSAQ